MEGAPRNALLLVDGTLEGLPAWPSLRIGVLGGTFDPPHLGHVANALAAVHACRLDAALLMPAGEPAYKADTVVASAQERLRMCSLACWSHSQLFASAFEAVRPEPACTADTLKRMRACLPAEVELSFIIGGDLVAQLPTWRRFEELGALARFICVERPGFEPGAEELAALDRAGIRLTRVRAQVPDISSSHARSLLAEGVDATSLLGVGVSRYIARRGLYRAVPLESAPAEAAGEPLALRSGEKAEPRPGSEHSEPRPGAQPEALPDSPATAARSVARAQQGAGPRSATSLQQAASQPETAPSFPPARQKEDPMGGIYGKQAYRRMRELVRARMSERRFEHSRGVARCARRLAKLYGVDPDKARMAGILHDWDKEIHVDQLRADARELGLQSDERVIRDMPWLLHGPTAAARLGREFPELDADVLQAIARHTSGASDMSPLDIIIYVADIIEPNRTYGDQEGIARLRGLVGQVSLQELYFEAFWYTLSFLVGQRKLLYPATIEVWNDLLAERRRRERAERDRAGEQGVMPESTGIPDRRALADGQRKKGKKGKEQGKRK